MVWCGSASRQEVARGGARQLRVWNEGVARAPVIRSGKSVMWLGWGTVKVATLGLRVLNVIAAGLCGKCAMGVIGAAIDLVLIQTPS